MKNFKLFLKNYFKLSKSGIVLLVLLTTFSGFLLSSFEPIVDTTLWVLMLGVYLVSSGSFILNQAHESHLDSLMDRTKTRPIPQGFFSTYQANIGGFTLVALGLLTLSFINMLVVLLALLTVLLYNFYYTLKWKKKYPYAAVVLGAIPGAMPVVIGYSAGQGTFLTLECAYLFLVMFLWQMPHFWSLAFRYRKDYSKANIPVLPVYIGVQSTFFYIGLYTLAYLGVVLLAPIFLKMSWIYLVIVFPFCVKIMFEFYYFYKNRQWMSFFSWLNMSLLVFLVVPYLDRWTISKLFDL